MVPASLSTRAGVVLPPPRPTVSRTDDSPFDRTTDGPPPGRRLADGPPPVDGLEGATATRGGRP